ncbi:unnamed protein product, partial [Ceratitis capitata]
LETTVFVDATTHSAVSVTILSRLFIKSQRQHLGKLELEQRRRAQEQQQLVGKLVLVQSRMVLVQSRMVLVQVDWTWSAGCGW